MSVDVGEAREWIIVNTGEARGIFVAVAVRGVGGVEVINVDERGITIVLGANDAAMCDAEDRKLRDERRDGVGKAKEAVAAWSYLKERMAFWSRSPMLSMRSCGKGHMVGWMMVSVKNGTMRM